MTVRKRGKQWYFDFQIKRRRYREVVPEARTQHDAKQAEAKAKREVFEGKYGKQFGTMAFTKFVGNPDADNDDFGEGTFLDWSKNNKRSWKHDRFRVRPLLKTFAKKALAEITPGAVEHFKSARLNSVTKRKTKRSTASVKHEIDLLSKIFRLAMTWGLADSNPCAQVSKLKLQNQRYRYLLPDEEPRLLAQCKGKRREHLATMIPFAIGTGARKTEQLTLRVRQCDFFRNLVVFDRTKSNKPRLVEMNSEVREILLSLCKGKNPDDYVWSSPKTGRAYDDIKKSFLSACRDAKIEGLVWHDLRATFGTRLGEAGFNAYDIAKLMGHANITTSQRYVRNLPVGAGEAVLLKNQRCHNRVPNADSATFILAANG